eukprot:TRINITY_DN37494_c0_g1_i2.p3 TRINITY_DN37494_c0_g1~~TRINITY_DN37494_c0_g1_i2.p3  ORF type:complete len:236 (+),score=35.12 TRINITY_DN37494_c0_g1_i2:75-710(+)
MALRGTLHYADGARSVALGNGWTLGGTAAEAVRLRGFAGLRRPAAVTEWVRSCGGAGGAAAALAAEAEPAEAASIAAERRQRPGPAARGPWPDWPPAHAAAAAACAAAAGQCVGGSAGWRLRAVGLRRGSGDYDYAPHVDYSPARLGELRAAVGPAAQPLSVWVSLTPAPAPCWTPRPSTRPTAGPRTAGAQRTEQGSGRTRATSGTFSQG